MTREKTFTYLAPCVALSMLAVGCGSGKTRPVRRPPERSGAATESTGTETAAAPATKKAIDPSSLGTLQVMVEYKGSETKNKKLNMTSDPACLSAHEKEAMDQRFIRNANQTMANAVVYLSKGHDSWIAPDAPSEAAVLDQVGCVYKPRVLAVQTKQDIDFKNSDPTLHNIHPTPKKNKAFNKATQANSKITKAFNREEIGINVKCDVHPWMKGYISVFKHPWFAVTPEGDGVATISKVPAGKYQVQAWHERLKTSKALDIEVKAGETAKVTLSF